MALLYIEQIQCRSALPTALVDIQQADLMKEKIAFYMGSDG